MKQVEMVSIRQPRGHRTRRNECVAQRVQAVASCTDKRRALWVHVGTVKGYNLASRRDQCQLSNRFIIHAASAACRRRGKISGLPIRLVDPFRAIRIQTFYSTALEDDPVEEERPPGKIVRRLTRIPSINYRQCYCLERAFYWTDPSET